MKNIMIILLVLICTASYAQKDNLEKGHPKKEMRQKRSNLSPEQRAELSTKKMTLKLDLNESQQKEMYLVELEHAKSRKEHFENRSNTKGISDSERFEMKSKSLDQQIAVKKRLKSILTEQQYIKWEKMRSTKHKGKMGKKKRSGTHSKKQ